VDNDRFAVIAADQRTGEHIVGACRLAERMDVDTAVVVTRKGKTVRIEQRAEPQFVMQAMIETIFVGTHVFHPKSETKENSSDIRHYAERSCCAFALLLVCACFSAVRGVAGCGHDGLTGAGSAQQKTHEGEHDENDEQDL
jgi:hypothetical protein